MSLRPHVLALILAILPPAAARQPFQPSDLWLWRSAEDPRITSDGSHLVYIEGWSDRSRHTSFSNLWVISSDGRERRQITKGEWRDRSPRWSPDGARLAWISDRDGKPRIWVGQAAIGTADLTPEALAWSPDGKSIAFVARGGMYVIPAAGGEARRLSGGELHYTGEPAWMPDGQNIVCAEQGGEIFAVRAADGAARELTHTGAINREPVPSPDGNRIAYTSADGKPHFYAPRQLWVMNADGSRARPLAGTLDRDVRHPQWSNESRTLYFIADDRGATHVYLARNDGTVRQLTHRAERLHGFSLADNGRAVTVRSSAFEGSALFTFMTDVPGGGYTLIDADEQLLAERDLGAVEAIEFQSAGRTMQAWFVKPPGFDAAKKYPLLLDLNDSPPRMRGVEFSPRAQILAARGFVVLLPNPRGSQGYGEEFGDLLPTQVGGDPADDAMRAVDAVVAKGYIDPQRLVLSGGVTAAWLLGHTVRFRSVVARRAIVNFAGDPATARWPHPELYGKRSPISFADQFKTRTLVIGNDGQSEELFAALQRRKVESEMVRVDDLDAELAWLVK